MLCRAFVSMAANNGSANKQNETKMKTEKNKKFQTPHEVAKHGDTKPAAKKKAVNGAVRKGKLGSLLGQSVISVMRAMGKHGWTFDEAKAALDKANISAATHTIRRALKRGQNGELRIAPVSAKELEALRGTPAKKSKSKAQNAAA